MLPETWQSPLSPSSHYRIAWHYVPSDEMQWDVIKYHRVLPRNAGLDLMIKKQTNPECGWPCRLLAWPLQRLPCHKEQWRQQDCPRLGETKETITKYNVWTLTGSWVKKQGLKDIFGNNWGKLNYGLYVSNVTKLLLMLLGNITDIRVGKRLSLFVRYVLTY